MKTGKNPQGLKLKAGVLLMLSAGTLVLPQIALASTAAGTVLRNTVVVNYADVGGTAMPSVSDSVDITVDHVASVAWGTTPTGQTVDSGAELSPAYSIFLTNTGNGSDLYNITDATTQSCTTGSLTAESFDFESAITLGATVSAGAAVFGGTNSTIAVSNLVAADFTAGDIVMVGATAFTVVSATADGDPLTNDTLVVAGDASAAINAAGIQIGERISFLYGADSSDAGTANGNAGSSTASATGCRHTHSLTAAGTLATGGNTQASATVSGWSTLINSLQLSVAKYVRNVSNPAKNPPTADIEYGTVDYYISGVTGNPTDELEYLIVISNGSSANATNVRFTDTLPDFTTYQTSSIAVDRDGNETFEIVTPTNETEADAELNGIITVLGQNIAVFPGIGGNENTDTGGTLSPSAVTAVKYTITID